METNEILAALTDAAITTVHRAADLDLLDTAEGRAFLRQLAALMDRAGDAETARWALSFPGLR